MEPSGGESRVRRFVQERDEGKSDSVSVPVQAQCANFEYMLWFESLLFYGFEEHSALEKSDGDIGLLPSIVEKVIVSKLTGAETRRRRLNRPKEQTEVSLRLFVCGSVLAEQVWDPLSSSQTATLVGFIHRLMKGYPTVLHGDNQYTQVPLTPTIYEHAESNRRPVL